MRLACTVLTVVMSMGSPGIMGELTPTERAHRDLDGRWICQGPTTIARFGRSGTRPLLDRRSGDGTTPAGVFPLGDVTVYSHAAVIGANLDPISGDQPGEIPFAAAIFLHRHSYRSDGSSRPTSGCVSLPQLELAESIRLLDPQLRPHFAIGPTWYLRATA